MKYLSSISVLVLFLMLGSPAFAEPAKGGPCREKEQAITKQLEIARQNNNHGKVRGLEKALASVRAWCSDGGLLAKAEEKVEEKQEEVKEREQDLAEAVAEKKGSDKIAKRERKLSEARSELQQALKERDALVESIKRADE